MLPDDQQKIKLLLMQTIFNLRGKLNPLIYLLILFCLFSSVANAQTSAWNTNSFRFSKDTIGLEDMTNATDISFSGSPVVRASPISFAGFSFRFGLNSYNRFYISPFGFIKLGSEIVSNNPENDSTVITPLYNGTSWFVSYKMTGAAPNRKLIIEYSGVMQPSGEPTRFQVWLYERTGKIQFLYAHLRGFYGENSLYNYKIFCATDILNKRTVAYAKVNPNDAFPVITYAGTSGSFDSIYAKTRFTFQPDTIKPTAPSLINFMNVQSGCLTVNITENSSNESAVVLERTDNSTNYHSEKIYFTDNAAGNTIYNYSQSLLRPFQNYNYRVYVSNGFLNSDTSYKSVKTLMPQINGIKKVPGDYPSITALLLDAGCKQLGPNLVIELQNNYSFSSETLPLTFGPALQNDLIKSIVIRPAANATIIWADSTRSALFYVDSVKHVFIDGRPGGTGTSQNLTIFQKNPLGSAIQYTNAADSGGINYCKILIKNFKYSSSAINVVPSNNTFNRDKKDINAFSITNNFISADSASVSQLIYIRPADTLQARDFIISGNQFSRFRNSAVHFEGGGDNLQIKNNLFFQPESFSPEVFLPYTNASCLSLLNIGKVTIDNNYFGGGSPAWGKGKFTLNSVASKFSFINYQSSSLTNKAIITNNKFGNIESIGYSSIKLILAAGGDVLIDHNRFGTSDSTNSITWSEYFWGLDLGHGNKKVSNNFFSGFQGGYLNSGTSNDSYFITGATDIIHNDIGGSNDPEANSSTGIIHGIYLGASGTSITIKGNIIRGISSKNSTVIAISGANGLSGSPQNNVEIDSNSIHHIQSPKNVTGIIVNLNSMTVNTISDNHIYALKTTGTAHGNYGPTGTLNGITYSIYNSGVSPKNYKGEVRISGNKIHSFESIRILPNSIFNYNAINVSSPISKTYNNEIRFGIDSKGRFIDSLTSLTGISIFPVDYQTLLTDKHYIEHNTIYFGGKGTTVSAISAQYDYNYVSQNNSIIITNNILNIDRKPLSTDYITPALFQNISSIKAMSSKNLWYSSTIPNTPALLQSYKNSCKCDSSSFVGNPVFINAAGDSAHYNLHLGAGSKADAMGTPSVLTVQNDLDNKKRNSYSPVDIGCYAATPCGSGTFPSITITNPTSDTFLLCSGNNLILKSSVSGGTFTNLQWQRNLTDTIGANTGSLLIKREGAYRLVGKTACGQVASRIIYVINNPLQPIVSISTPDKNICKGDAVTFFANTVNGGDSPSYQWQLNGDNTGANNDTFAISTLTDGDEVQVILSTVSCSMPAIIESNIISMNVERLPVAKAGNDAEICAGTGTQLSGSGGDTYAWLPTAGLSNPDIANPEASPSATTTYILTAINDEGCSAKDSVIVTVNAQANSPVVNINTPDSNICFGTSVTFTASAINGGTTPTYQWQINTTNAGSNSNIFNASNLNNNDKINVVLTSNANCLANKSVTSNIITMDIEQLDIPELMVSGPIITVTNPDVTATYTWQTQDNGSWIDITPIAKGNVYTAIATGNYRATAIKGGCIVYSDANVANVTRRLASSNPFGIYLYPNPSSRMIILDSIKLSEHWEILTITDITGKQVLFPVDIKNNPSVSIDISFLKNAVYFIRLRRSDGKFATLKFVKQ